MKKRLIILAAALVTALAAGGASIAAAAASGAEPEEPDAQSLTSRGYILMERDGVVGVYMDGELLRSLSVDPETLRAADRELLREGIERESFEDILMLVEDFDS